MVTRSYELLFIVSPELTEEGLEALLNRVQNYLTEAGAAVAEFRSWGMRRLSYSIKGFREGRYYLSRFTMATSAIKEFERRLLLVDGVLRELIILMEDVPEVAAAEKPTTFRAEFDDDEAYEPEDFDEEL